MLCILHLLTSKSCHGIDKMLVFIYLSAVSAADQHLPTYAACSRGIACLSAWSSSLSLLDLYQIGRQEEVVQRITQPPGRDVFMLCMRFQGDAKELCQFTDCHDACNEA